MFAPRSKFDLSNVCSLQLNRLVPAIVLLGALGLCVSSARGQNQPATPQPATSQPAAQAPATPAPVPVQQAEPSEGPQTLHLLVGRSIVISSPARIKRVSLADPNIAEAIVVSPTQVLVNGRAPGRRLPDCVGRIGPESGLSKSRSISTCSG